MWKYLPTVPPELSVKIKDPFCTTQPKARVPFNSQTRLFLPKFVLENGRPWQSRVHHRHLATNVTLTSSAFRSTFNWVIPCTDLQTSFIRPTLPPPLLLNPDVLRAGFSVAEVQVCWSVPMNFWGLNLESRFDIFEYWQIRMFACNIHVQITHKMLKTFWFWW